MPNHDEDQLSIFAGIALERPADHSVDADLTRVLADLDALKVDAGNVRFRKNDPSETAPDHAGNPRDRKALPAERAERPDDVPLVMREVTPLHLEPDSPSLSPSLTATSDTTAPTTTPTMQTHIQAWREKHPRLAQERKRKATLTKNRERKARLLPPAWAKAKEIDRAPFYEAAMLGTGHAVAISINFGPKALDRAAKAKGGAFDHMRRSVMRRLRAVLGHAPVLTVALDEAKGRFHLHGYVGWPSHDLPALHDALRFAAGEWGSAHGREHQIHLRSDRKEFNGFDVLECDQPLTSGWAGYAIKQAKRLRSETNHTTLYACPLTKRIAKQSYDIARQSMKSRSV